MQLSVNGSLKYPEAQSQVKLDWLFEMMGWQTSVSVQVLVPLFAHRSTEVIVHAWYIASALLLIYILGNYAILLVVDLVPPQCTPAASKQPPLSSTRQSVRRLSDPSHSNEKCGSSREFRLYERTSTSTIFDYYAVNVQK